MHLFTIKVVGHNGTTIHHALMASDFSATRRAQQLASRGDTIEVWRGDECIYLSEDLGHWKVA